MNRLLLLSSIAAFATACTGENPSGRFDFQDSWAGELESQTYAVGSSVDMVVFGPGNFDMNLTRARALDVDGDEAAIKMGTGTAYPEFGCVVAEGEAEVTGPARIAIADKLTGAPLDWVTVNTDTVDVIDLGRGIEWWGGGVDMPLGDSLNVLTGGSTTLSVTARNAEGTVLSGRLDVDAQASGVVVDMWEPGVLWIENATAGELTVDAGDHSQTVDIRTVAAAEIVSLQVRQVELGVGNTMDDGFEAQRGLLVVGLTEAGAEVAGVPAEWSVDSWDYGVGDSMTVWESGEVTACWSGLCASL